ncbi:ORF6C domain-containing protein, partial [Clostridium sp.]|uniref:ORF6C domain-containing protein n=1 Tax=Clostridium sp. TaxID=1506 RepID=UPI00258C94A0
MSNLIKNQEIYQENTNLTPIEIALGIDSNGRTTARKLYNFLELNISNYASWSKRNILENEFAEESIDYISFVVNDERNPKPTTDYKLSASFAKKLAMGTHNEKGELAKDYFVKIEDKLKEIAKDPYKNLSPELKAIFQIDKKQQEFEGRLEKLENNMTIDYAQQEKLQRTGRIKIVEALGGKDAPAYKRLNKKAFSLFWNDYKRYMGV